MSKNFSGFCFVIILGLFGVFVVAHGQTPPTSGEYISSFFTHISVNLDNSIDVTEMITYNTGNSEHHGIYRDIKPYSSQNRKMSIKNIIVGDKQGNPYQFEVSTVGGNVRIKIGDPNQTFSGEKVYILNYHATNAVAQLKDIDEIYWNATGNSWGMSILQAQASITLPINATGTQSSCYYGPQGSITQCQSITASSTFYSYLALTEIGPGDGLTIAAGFSKGIVTPYAPPNKVIDFFVTYWGLILGILLPLLSLSFSLRYWYKHGRDPKGRSVIIPEYDVPEMLTPLEVVGIVSEEVSGRHLSAEIVYLAIKGYVKIHQIDEKLLGLFSTADYELIKLKDSIDLPNKFDQQLLKSLFESNTETIKLSDLKNKFYSKAKSIINLVLDTFLAKGYYKNLGRMKSKPGRTIGYIFTALVTAVWLGMAGLPFFATAGFALAVIIFAIVSYFNPAKTEKGVKTKEYLLGLKMYLQIAEKDRLLFHNAPEKKPEVFEKLLPYAMVLGVADIWAKEFEGLYTTPPDWYSGPMGVNFSAIAFNNSLASFSTHAVSSMISAPGGSGGGGFSGGGGGGGGGGSW